MAEQSGSLLLLGGNRGDMVATFERAQLRIAERVGPVRVKSRDHWTEPLGFRDDQLFLNRALLVDTPLSPLELMETLIVIEKELGRIRLPAALPGPRTVDIDVLLMDERLSDDPRILLPHPRMHLRAFALAPSADIAPGLCHPRLGRTILQMLNDLRRRSV